MQRYVNYKTVIQQAELVAMPPESVDAFLRKRAGQTRWEWMNDVVDDETEAALAARKDPIVSLALARFGRHIDVLRPMFQAAPLGSAIRLAILSNTSAGGALFEYMPVSLFPKPEDAATWLVDCPEEELSALFENQSLGDSFLRDVLESKKPWDAIDEPRLAAIVIVLCRNERMKMAYNQEERGMDGYGEYSHGSVFNAAWLLAGKVQTSKRWAIALGSLYENLTPDAFQVDKPLEVAARWQVDPSDPEMVEKQRKSLELGYLGMHQSVRCGLARLALRKDPRIAAELLKSEDVAMRAAVYRSGEMGANDLHAGYERDGPLLYNQALPNEKVWRRQESRAALSTIAWAVCTDHQKSDLLMVNIYNDRNRDHRKKHPEWFGDDPTGGAVEASDEPATKADLQALAEAIGTGNTTAMQAMQNIFDSVKVMAKHVEWTWLFALGALVMGIWNRWR